MSISIEKRYELMFEEHRFASEVRIKLVRDWLLMYGALAVGFAWFQANAQPLSWLVTFLALVLTFLLWIADYRVRRGLRVNVNVGAAIEQRSIFSDDQRFFRALKSPPPRCSRLVSLKDRCFTHSHAIDIFAIVVTVGLILATRYLFLKRGVLVNPYRCVCAPSGFIRGFSRV